MGTKTAENWNLGTLGNGGKLGGKMGKNARKLLKNRTSGHFSRFSRPFFPHFMGEAKFQYPAIFVPISGQRPEMDLYQVHEIPSLTIFHRSLGGRNESLLRKPGFPQQGAKVLETVVGAVFAPTTGSPW